MDTVTSLPDVIAARSDLVRRQLRALLRFYVAAIVVVFLVGLATGDGLTVVLSAVNFAAWLACWLLLRADRLQPTGLLVCAVVLATAVYSTSVSKFGILDSTATLFAAVAVFAVLLLRRALMVAVLVVTVVAIFAVGFRVELGLHPQVPDVRTMPVDSVVVVLVVAILALVVRHQHNHQWRALTTSLLQEQALQIQAEQLLDSERRWRTLVHAAPEWIMQIDRDGVVRFSNREHLPGPAGCLGRRLDGLVDQGERAALTGAIDEVFAGDRPAPLEVGLVLEGRLRRCVMTLGPLGGSGGVTGAIVLVSDETDRRHLQMQLEQAQRLDSLGRLAGGIAHDFNNLLTVISGHTDLAASSGSLPPDVVEDLDAISTACGRASDLTGRILAFGRQQPQQAQPLPLNDTVEHLAPMLRRLLGEGMDLDLDLAPDLPPVVGDAGQFEQVVVNLVVNARDAVREADRRAQAPAASGFRIAVRTRPLAPGEADEGNWLDEPPAEPGVALVVEDTGTGMEGPVLQRAFEPFYSTKPKGEGSGLGLAMVYGIVKQNRGAIRIGTAPGSGTTVTVALPARPDLAVGDEAQDVAAAAPGDAVPDGATILLVEDEPAVRDLSRRMLEKFGYRVVEADGLQDALAAANLHSELAVVLTDIVMPGGTGLELAERLPADLPVLFTSGYAVDQARDVAGEIPEGRFLQKPFTPQELAAALRSVIAGD